MRVAVGVLASMLLAGCTPGVSQQSTSSPSPKTTSSPTSSPASTTLGVAVDRFNSPTYRVLLFDTNARVVAQATARQRSIHPETTTLPETSTSGTTTYYLDGDFSVRFLSPDGKSDVAAVIRPFITTGIRPVQDVEAAFAVSPDQKRIAVAIVSYSNTTVYVADLDGSNRTDIYDGPIIEWPVGWWRGQLVLQLGDLNVGGHGSQRGYHIVSATTGTRSAGVCETGKTWGVPTMAGTLCQKDGGLFQLAWDATGPAVKGDCEQHEPYGAALKPDGTSVATNLCGSSGTQWWVNNSDGSGSGSGSNGLVLPVGWLDQYFVVSDNTQIRLYLASGFITPALGDHAIFVGAVPTELS